MSINTSDIAKLREATGAGMLDCKKALDEAAGDFDKAIEYLRKRGIAKAAKRAGKVAAEGVVRTYLHGATIGVLVEVNSETDFVAKNDQFLSLADDIAMHIAAAAPQYVSREDVPEDVVAKEKEIHAEQLKNEGKPAEMIEKIVEGKLNKFYSEICLLEQPFIKDEDKTIEQLLVTKTGEIGEKISVRRFARFVVGEGIQKEEKNFVDEVSEQLGE
jgi:elongation factor Ts